MHSIRNRDYVDAISTAGSTFRIRTRNRKGQSMKQGLTHIHFILDRSGSMESIKKDTIGGFNAFLQAQKAAPGEATMTVVQFDTQDAYEVITDRKPISEAKELTSSTFTPRAGTPLYDAIGRGINELGKQLSDLPEDQRPEKVAFVILTDGEENSSKEFVQAKVLEMIKHQTEKYSWQFMFLGANIDAINVAKGIGIAAQSALTFAPNAIGTTSAYAGVARVMTCYRSAAPGAQLAFDAQAYADQKVAGVASQPDIASLFPPLTGGKRPRKAKVTT